MPHDTIRLPHETGIHPIQTDVTPEPEGSGAARASATASGCRAASTNWSRALIVLVRDERGAHVSPAMRELAAQRQSLTVVLLPAYAPQLCPDEGLWARVKRSPANLASVALHRRETLVHNRLKRLFTGPVSSAASSLEPGSAPAHRRHAETPASAVPLRLHAWRQTCPHKK
jgi:hypothetical protein